MFGKIGITPTNNIFFKLKTVYIECRKFDQLTEVKGVLYWNTDGTIVIDTNYGAESFDMQTYMDDLLITKSIYEEMKDIEGFNIG